MSDSPERCDGSGWLGTEPSAKPCPDPFHTSASPPSPEGPWTIIVCPRCASMEISRLSCALCGAEFTPDERVVIEVVPASELEAVKRDLDRMDTVYKATNDAYRQKERERENEQRRAKTAEAEAKRYREALEKIAAPIRPDGTYNRDREACGELARSALSALEESA